MPEFALDKRLATGLPLRSLLAKTGTSDAVSRILPPPSTPDPPDVTAAAPLPPATRSASRLPPRLSPPPPLSTSRLLRARVLAALLSASVLSPDGSRLIVHNYAHAASKTPFARCFSSTLAPTQRGLFYVHAAVGRRPAPHLGHPRLGV